MKWHGVNRSLSALDVRFPDRRIRACAAFSAAQFQAPYVRQPKTWLYVREQEVSKFEKLIEVRQVDSGENLVVVIPG
jgi:hypothetical protein